MNFRSSAKHKSVTDSVGPCYVVEDAMNFELAEVQGRSYVVEDAMNFELAEVQGRSCFQGRSCCVKIITDLHIETLEVTQRWPSKKNI